MLSIVSRHIKGNGDVLWMILAQFSLLLSTSGVLFLIAALSGKHTLGVFSLSYAIYSVASYAACFGIGQTLTHFIAVERTEDVSRQYVAGIAILLCLIISSIVALMLYLSAGVLARIFSVPELIATLRTMSMAIIFYSLNNALLGYLNGIKDYRSYSIRSVIKSIVVLILMWTILNGFNKINYYYIMLPFVASECVVFIWLFSNVMSLDELKYFLYANDSHKILHDMLMLARFSWKVSLSGMIGMIGDHGDKLVLGYLMDVSTLGVYSLCVSISRLLNVISGSIAKVVFPIINECWVSGDKERFFYIASSTVFRSGILFSVLSVFAFAVSPWFLSKFIGDNVDIVPVLGFLFSGSMFFSTAATMGFSFIAMGKPMYALIVSLTTTSLSIMSSFLLIPRYGLVGASAAQAIGMLSGGSVLLMILNISSLTRSMYKSYAPSFLTFVLFFIISAYESYHYW